MKKYQKGFTSQIKRSSKIFYITYHFLYTYRYKIKRASQIRLNGLHKLDQKVFKNILYYNLLYTYRQLHPAQFRRKRHVKYLCIWHKRPTCYQNQIHHTQHTFFQHTQCNVPSPGSGIFIATKDLEGGQVITRMISLNENNLECEAIPQLDTVLTGTTLKSTRCALSLGNIICCGGIGSISTEMQDSCYKLSDFESGWEKLPATLTEKRQESWAVDLGGTDIWFTGGAD